MKLPEDLKFHLGQLIFWAVVVGIVLVGIAFVDEVIPVIRDFLESL